VGQQSSPTCGDEQRARRLCSAYGRGKRISEATRSIVESIGQLIVRFPDGSEKRLADTTPDEIVGPFRNEMDGNFRFGP
jgi:hypothetical protein